MKRLALLVGILLALCAVAAVSAFSEEGQGYAGGRAQAARPCPPVFGPIEAQVEGTVAFPIPLELWSYGEGPQACVATFEVAACGRQVATCHWQPLYPGEVPIVQVQSNNDAVAVTYVRQSDFPLIRSLAPPIPGVTIAVNNLDPRRAQPVGLRVEIFHPSE